MVGESNQTVFIFQKDASCFAEFEISEFEIARVDLISDNKHFYEEKKREIYFACRLISTPWT